MLAGRDVHLVTPEAVVLQLETAGLGSRILAFVVDALIQALVGIVLVGGLFVIGPDSVVTVVVMLVAVTVGGLAYHPIFETFNRGRSPGKMLLGLRVVTREGGSVRFRHAAIRGLLAIVDFQLTYGLAALVSVLATQDNQRLGDLVAGTLVVRERSGAGAAPRPMEFRPPAGFEAFAASLDVAGMGGADYEAVRSYVSRRDALRPEVRSEVARSLARPLSSKLGHAPPSGLDADVYLRCLAAAYQDRLARREPGPAVAPPPPVATDDPWPGNDDGFAPPS